MALTKKLVVTSGLAVALGGALVWALRSAPSVDSSGPKPRPVVATAPSAHAGEHVHASPELAAGFTTARAHAEPDARREGVVQVLAEAGEREPASAARLAMTLTTADGRDEALHEVIGHYLAADPDAARAWLHELAAREDAELNLVLARVAGRHDAKLGLELARRVHENLRAPVLHELFANWAASDPQLASAEAAKLENPKDRRAAGSGAVTTWAQTEPQAAWAWSSELAPDGVRRPVLESLVSTWAEHDPGAAARAAIEAQSSSRQRLLDVAMSAWVMRDIDAALSWLQSVPDAQARAGAATAALIELGQTKPEEAAERAEQWAQRDPSEAANGVLEKVRLALSARAGAR